MSDFLFSIGQVVTTRVALEEARRWCDAGELRFPRLLQVVERRTVECSGGLQRGYLVGGMGELKLLMEIELCVPAAFDYAGATVAAGRARREQRRLLDEMEWAEVERREPTAPAEPKAPEPRG